MIAAYRSMATGPLQPFADCVQPFCLLNPQHVGANQLKVMQLEGKIAITGGAGNWTATFTITGPGTPPPTNGSLKQGMSVSGAFMPAGATVSELPARGQGQTVKMHSKATTNPFHSPNPAKTHTLFFVTQPVTSKLGTFFDLAIDNFFAFCLANNGHLRIQENNGQDTTYSAAVTTASAPSIDGKNETYTVLQFTGGNDETYNIFYPFFTTNSVASKKDPLGKPVVPPPAWWMPNMKIYEPPSMMVFAAEGAFADSTQQYPKDARKAAILGALENAVVTGLARGSILGWKYRQGTIAPNGQSSKTATVTVTGGGAVDQDLVGRYLYSPQLAIEPMTVKKVDLAANTLQVCSPLPLLPTAPGLLTFSKFYEQGGTWSAYANFLHNGTQQVTIGGRAYALPYDDQGGFSTDLTSIWTSTPSVVSVTLNPW